MRPAITLSLFAAAGILALAVADARAAPPCFQQARAFGEAVTAMGNLAGTIENPSPKVREATAMRNQGMEACLAGRARPSRSRCPAQFSDSRDPRVALLLEGSRLGDWPTNCYMDYAAGMLIIR
jgi:hypothetical protein